MINLELRGIYPDQVLRLQFILGQLDREYPDCIRTVRTYTKRGDESLASEQNGILSLNLFWFGRPLMVLQEAALKGNLVPHGVVDVAPWHAHMREPDHIFNHEFAHGLRTKLGRKALEFAIKSQKAALQDPILAPTGYSLINAEEWFAEAFAVLRAGREHDWTTPQVQQMKRFLEDL